MHFKQTTLLAAGSILFSAAASANAELIITEVMANPLAVEDTEGEYFEVYNTGAPISVSSLTISDDGSDSANLSEASGTIGTNEFFVFGNNGDNAYVDLDYYGMGGFYIGNGEDEIVVSDTSSGTELARLNYDSGNAEAGLGIARVLDNINNSNGSGVTQTTNYSGEVAEHDTLPNSDIGSPGSAGSTVIPEPSSLALFALGSALVAGHRFKPERSRSSR